MSDRRMALPSDADPDIKRRAELMWYVREPTPEIVATLRWLAKYPFIDQTRLGFGHRIPMPAPPVAGSDFRTFLFLTPVVARDQRIAEKLSIEGDAVDILTVNLISDAEYRLIQQEGLDPFLDLLDENDYPAILDPARKSYVPIATDDGAVPYAARSSVKPRHVLCILGRDRDLQSLREAARAAIAEVATGFSIDETYSQAEPDQQMSRSFSVCWDRVEPNARTTADEEAVSRHQSVLYVVGPRMAQDDAVAVSIGALFLVDRLIKAGAVAVKGESAGVAHGLRRWRELIGMGAAATERDHALAQSRVCRWAFAKRPLSSGDYLASVGFHLAGLPDVQVAKSRGSEREIVAIIDEIADEIVKQGIDAALRAYDASLIECSSYEQDDFKFNPYGIVRISV